MKKIVIIAHCFPPARGGLEFLLGEISQILAEEYEVIVITGKGSTLDSYKTFDHWVDEKNSPPLQRVENIEIIRLNLNFFWQRLANKFLNKIALHWTFWAPFYFGPLLKYDYNTKQIISQADLIIGAGIPTMTFVDSWRFAKRFNKPLLLHPSFHEVGYHKNSRFFKKTLDFGKKIIFQTATEKNGLADNYSISSSKFVQLTYCPYPLEKINKRPSTPKTIFTHLKSKTITFGFIGQITQRKNLKIIADFLLQYESQWQQQGWYFKVIMAGVKTNTSDLVESFFTKVKTSVDFIYNFENKEDIFSKIDIFINPSYEESLGIVNFEAIFYQRLILIHRQAPFLDLFETSANFSFENADELNILIMQILNNSTQLNDLLTEQNKILLTYNTEAYSQQLHQLVLSMLI